MAGQRLRAGGILEPDLCMTTSRRICFRLLANAAKIFQSREMIGMAGQRLRASRWHS